MSDIKHLTQAELTVIDTAVNMIAAALNVKPDLIIRILADGGDLNSVPYDRFQYMIKDLKTNHFVLSPDFKARTTFKPKVAVVPGEPDRLVFNVINVPGIRWSADKEYRLVVKQVN